jgi:hypothetical protein
MPGKGEGIVIISSVPILTEDVRQVKKPLMQADG